MLRSTSLFTRIRLLAAALALPALFGAVPVQANVRTTIPGAACYVDPFFANPGNILNAGGNGAYSIGNQTSTADTSIRVVCPMSRSLPLETDGMSDVELRFASTTSQGSSPSCTIASIRRDGTILQSAQKSVLVPGDGQATMDFAGAITNSDSKGTYFASCLLPLTVQLISVYHSENDGVSGN